MKQPFTRGLFSSVGSSPSDGRNTTAPHDGMTEVSLWREGFKEHFLVLLCAGAPGKKDPWFDAICFGYDTYIIK